MYGKAVSETKSYTYPSVYILNMFACIYAKLLFYLAIIVCNHNQKRDKNSQCPKMRKNILWYENNNNYIYKYNMYE